MWGYLTSWPHSWGMWEVVGLSGWLVGLFYVCLVVWTVLRKRKPRPVWLWTSWLKGSRGWKESDTDRRSSDRRHDHHHGAYPVQ